METFVSTGEREQSFTLAHAEQLAEAAHSGQVDQGDGGTYVRHPWRVMTALAPYGPVVQMAGILHDVVEDSSVTLDDLRKLDIPEEVVEAVDSVTKRDGETYDQLIARGKRNSIGRLVRLADNRDNSNQNRMIRFSPEERARRQLKYERALNLLIDGDVWLQEQVACIDDRVRELYTPEHTHALD